VYILDWVSYAHGMTITESCRELCKQKYGAKYQESLFEMALSRARLEMIRYRTHESIEEHLKWIGCHQILKYYAQERDIMIQGCGGFDGMDEYV
jgi:CRISPR/Cas system-associated endoribonuclease Cas2